MRNNFSKICNVPIDYRNRGFLEIEKIDMVFALKSIDFLERIFHDSEDNEYNSIKFEDHKTTLIKIDQDLSFLSKIIPEFAFNNFTKIGVNEMK